MSPALPPTAPTGAPGAETRSGVIGRLGASVGLMVPRWAAPTGSTGLVLSAVTRGGR